MFRHTLVLTLVYPLTVIALFQQSTVNDKMSGACGEAGTPYARQDLPVVHGTPYVVPTLRVRVSARRASTWRVVRRFDPKEMRN